METRRLPRFNRVAVTAPIQLTARDREIVRLIHRHRFLRSSHLAALLGGSRQQLLRRLQRLYHHRYLDRPRAQIDYFHAGGSRCIAYGLGPKGTALMKPEQSHTRLAPVSRLFLEHALMTSDIMVALELACRGNNQVRMLAGDELDLPAATQRLREPLHWNVNLNGRTSIGVVPDRVFALEFADLPKERNRVLYFLEADRGTMPVARRTLAKSSFRRKLLAYEATWNQGVPQSRFGFQRCRVLTVTTSAARVESLVAACAELASGQGLFLFGDLAALLACDDPLTFPFLNGRGQPTTLLE